MLFGSQHISPTSALRKFMHNLQDNLWHVFSLLAFTFALDVPHLNQAPF